MQCLFNQQASSLSSTSISLFFLTNGIFGKDVRLLYKCAMIGYFLKRGYLSQILTFLKNLQNRNKTNSRLISAISSKHNYQTIVLSRVYFKLQSAQCPPVL